MSFDVKAYGPDEVTIVFGAIPISSGYADGDFCTVEFDEDAFSLQVGTDGEGARSKSNNRSATITISLMQTADANDLLSAQHQLDLNSAGGVGIVPLLIADRSGRSLYVAQKAWIQKMPGATFGREAGPREWVIRTNNLIAHTGGN